MKHYQISIKGKDPLLANIIVSAIPPRKLYNLLPKRYNELIYNPSVNVVNLVYTSENAHLPSPGFGYLIPRSEHSATKHQGLLGVVFDSCAIPSQDQGSTRGNVLKLTAMIGGHMFDQVVTNNKESSLEAFFESSAIERVKKHLNIETTPEIARVHIHRECIPQYMVGHLQRMQSLDQMIREEYEGMLAVTGAGYLGVSVNDCIKNAREVSEAMISRLVVNETDGEGDLVGDQEAVTGLERSWFM